MSTTLSWKAKRNGNTYCAPACGRGCTHAEYRKANRMADALVKKCEKEAGGKWEKRVHENLGWHYSVGLVGGDISIREYKGTDKPYSISAHGGGSPSQVNMRAHSNSIKWLVDTQLKEVQQEADIWNEYLSKNKKSLNRK